MEELEVRGRRGGRRQRFTLEQKRQIVEATLEPGASVACIAREFAVNANQVFAWRRSYKQGLLAERGSVKLLPVCVTGEAKNGALCESDLRGRAAGAIHIEFPGIALVTVEGCPSAESLRIVLESLLR